MSTRPETALKLNRRSFLQLGAGLAGLAHASQFGRSETPFALSAQAADKDKPVSKSKPTTFQIACMTLPYAQFPLERALAGIKAAGYKYVAWGTSHQEAEGKQVPVM